FDGHASRAIDGNTDGDYFRSRSVTHTQTESNPWWEVKLPATAAIDHIAIWNRLDGVEERLKGAKVQVLNDRHEAVWEQTIKDAPKPTAELDLDGAEIQLKRAFAGLHPDQFILVTAQPANISEEKLLVIKLQTKDKQKKLPLDSFRLSVTSEPTLLERS